MPVCTVQVPKSRHGAIIGPKGSIINGIREETGCRVTIPRDESSGVLLEAPDEAALTAAVDRISEIVGFPVDERPLCNMALGVDPSEFGRVIGSRGSTLRSIEASAGCIVTVPSRDRSEVTHLTLQGRREACEAGKALVEEAIGRETDVIGTDDGGPVGKLAPEKVVKYMARSQSMGRVVEIHECLMFPDNDPSIDKFSRFLDYLRSAQSSIKVSSMFSAVQFSAFHVTGVRLHHQ